MKTIFRYYSDVFVIVTLLWSMLLVHQVHTSIMDNRNSNDDDDNNNSNNSEVTYVNSGQSVLLVCDLPNSMPDGQVLFVKADNKLISVGTDILEDGDEQRFEVNQQYAWEWSLKISSINEDDSGNYYCKVGSMVIKQYKIIVRVPPRIRDDLVDASRQYNEGDTVKFTCNANGVPRPNITWFIINEHNQSLKQLQGLNNILVIKNITRKTPRYYYCKASNGIPPNDNRNFTFKINFAPEIEVKSKYDAYLNEFTLNCTINAYPLTNKYFWRKDGNFLGENGKYTISNLVVNDHTIVSVLKIKNYVDRDKGLYECTAENDMRVSKVIFNLNGVKDQENNRVQEKLINSNIAVASIKNIEKNKAKNDDASPETSPELLLTKFYRSRNKLNKPTSTTTAKTKIIMTILDDPDYDRLPSADDFYGSSEQPMGPKSFRNQYNSTSKIPSVSLFYRFEDSFFNGSSMLNGAKLDFYLFFTVFLAFFLK